MVELELKEVLAAADLDSATPFFKQREAQLEYYLTIVNQWQLKPGGKYLFLGSGQSDLLLIMALAIGHEGLIENFEITPGSGGAPITLGITETQLGNLECQIHFHSAEFLTFAEFNFLPVFFDGLIIAHAAWYFSSNAQLERLIRQAATIIPRIYFVEWDLNFTNYQQWGAYLACLWQGEIAHLLSSEATNLRSVISYPEICQMLKHNYYQIQRKFPLNTAKLTDGRWQLTYVLVNGQRLLEQLAPTLTWNAVLNQNLELMETLDWESTQSLPSYSLIAKNDLVY